MLAALGATAADRLTAPLDEDPAALFSLGMKHAVGNGVPKDLIESIICFRRAAELGDARSQNQLGTIFANGEGVARDFIEALAWFNIAAVTGTKSYIENRDTLEHCIGIEATLAAQMRSKMILAGFEAMKRANTLKIAETSTPSSRGDGAVDPAASEKVPNEQLPTEYTSKAEPHARLRLTAAQSNILSNQVTGSTNICVLGIDARWSGYEEYMNELLKMVQKQWYKILQKSRVSPLKGSHGVITFKLNSKGETEIVKVEESDAGKQGVFHCQNAITYPQPFDKWPEQRIAVLGDEQQITLSFYYR